MAKKFLTFLTFLAVFDFSDTAPLGSEWGIGILISSSQCHRV